MAFFHISNSWAAENGNKTVWLILWASMWISVFTLSSHYISKTAIIAANYRPQRQTSEAESDLLKILIHCWKTEGWSLLQEDQEKEIMIKKVAKCLYLKESFLLFFSSVFLTQVSIYCFSSKVCTNDPVLFIRLRKMHCHMTTFLNKHVTSWTNNNNRAGPMKWR